jgi:chromosome segregation ATPase
MSDNEEGTTTEAPKPAAPAPKAQSQSELPEWAREQISKANEEAATYRVRLREEQKARKSLEDSIASLSSEKSEATSDFALVKADLDKLKTAIQAEIPHENLFTFAKTLQGSTPDELSAHAAELKSMFGTKAPVRAVDRSQGKGSGPNDQQDPSSEFAKFIQASLQR